MLWRRRTSARRTIRAGQDKSGLRSSRRKLAHWLKIIPCFIDIDQLSCRRMITERRVQVDPVSRWMFLSCWSASRSRFCNVSFCDAVAGRRSGRPRACVPVGDTRADRAGQDDNRNPRSADRSRAPGAGIGYSTSSALASLPSRLRVDYYSSGSIE